MCFSDIRGTMEDGIATAYSVVTYYRKSIYMYVYMYVYIYIYTHTHIHTYMHTYSELKGSGIEKCQEYNFAQESMEL